MTYLWWLLMEWTLISDKYVMILMISSIAVTNSYPHFTNRLSAHGVPHTPRNIWTLYGDGYISFLVVKLTTNEKFLTLYRKPETLALVTSKSKYTNQLQLLCWTWVQEGIIWLSAYQHKVPLLSYCITINRATWLIPCSIICNFSELPHW